MGDKRRVRIPSLTTCDLNAPDPDGCLDAVIRTTEAYRRRDGRRGASMLAAATGIFVLGLAIAIGVPMMQKSQRRARVAATVEQLRVFGEALQAQAKKADWPPGVRASGEMPAGLDPTLSRAWKRRTPIGGRYLWAPDTLQRGQRYRAAIILYPLANDPVSDDPRLLEEIDRQLDDGDLHSGNFQLGYRDQPFFVIEQ